ncbi:MAG: hypothetical protein KF779_03955 [Hyphomonadaceae bacterium]|nr:hypothetical protein [Hyphomonadaceae bacterium]
MRISHVPLLFCRVLIGVSFTVLGLQLFTGPYTLGEFAWGALFFGGGVLAFGGFFH